MAVFENELYGHFDKITFSDPRMKHNDDCSIEKNYYICPKEEYYCKDTHGTPITRYKRLRRQNNHNDPVIISSVNRFPKRMKDGENLLGCKNFMANEVEVKSRCALEKFLIFFIRPCFRNQVFIGILNVYIPLFFAYKKNTFFNLAHNGSNYDTLLLSQALFNEGITPSVITKGNKILSMTVAELNIVFVDSIRYIKASLSKCCTLYNLNMKKGTFPVRANIIKFYTSTTIPPFEWFINENDSTEAIKEKQLWYLERRKKLWVFKDEIAEYCTDDSFILCQIILKFTREWFNLQEGMANYFDVKLPSKFHPFCPPFITLGRRYYIAILVII